VTFIDSSWLKRNSPTGVGVIRLSKSHRFQPFNPIPPTPLSQTRKNRYERGKSNWRCPPRIFAAPKPQRFRDDGNS
jgi:hypothetical protein